MSNFDVRDEAIAQLGLALAQVSIDKALVQARLNRAKEIVEAVIEAIDWMPVPGVEDEGRRMAMIPGNMVGTLQSVVTSL